MKPNVPEDTVGVMWEYPRPSVALCSELEGPDRGWHFSAVSL